MADQTNEGGGFGNLGGKPAPGAESSGYGELNTPTEGHGNEATSGGSYSAVYPEAGEATPGGYGKLAQPDNGGDEAGRDSDN